MRIAGVIIIMRRWLTVITRVIYGVKYIIKTCISHPRVLYTTMARQKKPGRCRALLGQARCPRRNKECSGLLPKEIGSSIGLGPTSNSNLTLRLMQSTKVNHELPSATWVLNIIFVSLPSLIRSPSCLPRFLRLSHASVWRSQR